MEGDIGRVVAKLEAISEELTDIAMDRLREAMAAGETAVPVDEKRINRARRAIERAAAILRAAGDGEDDTEL
jgi:quinolinate synthase